MGLAGKALDIYIAYKFIQLLVVPFDQTDAYKLGIIDGEGKILRKRKDLQTQEEKKAYPSIFYTLVWKIKGLLEKLPFGKSKLASIAAAAYFLKEHVRAQGGDAERVEDILYGFLADNGFEEMLESRHSTVIENGTYLVEGDILDLNEYLDPVDIVLGFPIYEVNGKVFTHEDLQRIN